MKIVLVENEVLKINELNVDCNDDLINKKKLIATPAVRRIIREKNINLDLVNGTGRNGRVLKEDLFKFLDVQNQQNAGNKFFFY